MTGDSIQPNLRTCQNHGLAPVLRSPVATLASGVAGSRYISRVPGNLFLCCLHSLPGSPKVEIWPQKLQTSIILTASIPCRLCVCVCVCVCVCAVPQSCWARCNPVDCSLPGSSVEFSPKEYWSGLPFLPPGDLPDSGIKSETPALQADSLPTEPAGKCLV